MKKSVRFMVLIGTVVVTAAAVMLFASSCKSETKPVEREKLAFESTEFKAGVKVELESVKNDIYRIVFRAAAPQRIKLFDTVFSFDNEVIKPVAAANFKEIGEEDFDAGTTAPFALISPGGSAPFSELSMGWKTEGNRTAFNYCGFTTGFAATDNSYIDLFEFYFKLQDGKTADDIKADIFKFESGLDEGGFVDMYFPTNNGQGIRLEEGIIDEIKYIYFWGHHDQATNPDALEVTIF